MVTFPCQFPTLQSVCAFTGFKLILDQISSKSFHPFRHEDQINRQSNCRIHNLSKNLNAHHLVNKKGRAYQFQLTSCYQGKGSIPLIACRSQGKQSVGRPMNLARSQLLSTELHQPSRALSDRPRRFD